MNMITKLATKVLAVLSVVAMIASPAAGQGLSASDMAFAFGGKADAPAAAQQTARAATPKAAEPVAIASARGMTQTEMQETEGAWLNFAIGGAIGLGSYAWNTPRDQWSFRGAATNTAIGIGGGGLARAAGVKAWASVRSRGGGISFGNSFRADWHRFNLNGTTVNRPHYHRYSSNGSKRSFTRHRPWQSGW